MNFLEVLLAVARVVSVIESTCNSLIESSYFNAYDDSIKLSRIQSIKRKKYNSIHT